MNFSRKGNMGIYKAKGNKIKGTSFREVYKKAWRFYQSVIQKSKRKPYVRSAYFKRDKIFLGLFWSHLHEKNQGDKKRRMPYLPLAIELIKKSKFKPESKSNANKSSEILHRFKGLDNNGNIFNVQIKENKNQSKKWLISVYPEQ